MEVSFEIPYTVKAKQGDRSGVARPKGRKPFVRHWTPDDVAKNAENLAALVAPYRPAKPLEGPLYLLLRVHYPWRKAESKKRRERAQWKDTKPDVDNIAKQLCDVLQASGFFVNDAQIACLTVKKLWTERPSVVVKIVEM